MEASDQRSLSRGEMEDYTAHMKSSGTKFSRLRHRSCSLLHGTELLTDKREIREKKSPRTFPFLLLQDFCVGVFL